MKGVAVFLLTIAVLVGLIWTVQRRLVYFPSAHVPDFPAAQEVRYGTDDGLALVAWFVPASTPATVATVVVFPGNAGNRAGRLPLAHALSERGYGTVLVDYRGYGGNPGSPTEARIFADARAAFDRIAAHPDVDPQRIVYFGESLGASVAIDLATSHPPAALILRSPFTSLADVAAVHYRFLPTSWLLRDRFANRDTIARVDVPVLVVAGTADAIVPVDQSIQIHAAAPGPAQLVLLDGADHNDRALLDGPLLLEAIEAFLREFLPR